MKRVGISRRLAGCALILGLAACGTVDSGRATELSLSKQPLLGKFVWHDLMTEDVAASRRFYGGLFGWSFKETTHPNGGSYTLITLAGKFVGGIVHLDDPEGIEYSRWLGYVSVPDVDESVALTTESGGRAVVGPLDLANIGRVAAIQDPQGAVVGLLRSKPGDPADGGDLAAGQVVWNELLAADDLRAANFYSRITGARAKFTNRRGGKYIILRSNESERAGIMARPSDDVEPFWLTHFAVADPGSAARRAAELGGEVLLAPSPELRNGSLAVVSDPTGAVLALHKWPE